MAHDVTKSMTDPGDRSVLDPSVEAIPHVGEIVVHRDTDGITETYLTQLTVSGEEELLFSRHDGNSGFFHAVQALSITTMLINPNNLAPDMYKPVVFIHQRRTGKTAAYDARRGRVTAYGLRPTDVSSGYEIEETIPRTSTQDMGVIFESGDIVLFGWTHELSPAEREHTTPPKSEPSGERGFYDSVTTVVDAQKHMSIGRRIVGTLNRLA